MSKDKYSAVWVSHTSINDFLTCPRAYYLKNIYRDPKTGHKIKIISPPLAFGQIIHEVLDDLSVLPAEKRFKESLVITLHKIWGKISDKKGGFVNHEVEDEYKKRGEAMLLRLMKNPGPLLNKAVKIKMDLPYYWLSEEENLILCGKIDWLEYLTETDSVHIIDFKTNKTEEKIDSLQLPIYYLIVHHCQKWPVSKASYWYLEKTDGLVEKTLPDLRKAQTKVLEIARKIKVARQLNVFKCPYQIGCRSCRPYEAVLQGEAEFIGVDNYSYNVYINKITSEKEKESYII